MEVAAVAVVVADSLAAVETLELNCCSIEQHSFDQCCYHCLDVDMGCYCLHLVVVVYLKQQMHYCFWAIVDASLDGASSGRHPLFVGVCYPLHFHLNFSMMYLQLKILPQHLK